MDEGYATYERGVTQPLGKGAWGQKKSETERSSVKKAGGNVKAMRTEKRGSRRALKIRSRTLIQTNIHKNALKRQKSVDGRSLEDRGGHVACVSATSFET